MSDELDPAGDFIDACIDNLDEARRLFAADPQVVYLTKIGSPTLHWMVIEDFQIGAQRLLEEFKIDVDYRDEPDETALHRACWVGNECYDSPAEAFGWSCKGSLALPGEDLPNE